MSTNSRFQTRGHWPKQIPTLTPEQERIREDFYALWLTTLPQRFGVIEMFNHRYPLRTLSKAGEMPRTLDVGAGLGTHIGFEDLSRQEYTALELRPDLAEPIKEKYPSVKILIGDIQERLEVPDGYFDRVLAIHVLEHLPKLPNALDEIHRILSPDGWFSVLIPADPGFAYNLARNISARRIFEQRYKQSYDWFIACEHINAPDEILGELKKRFDIVQSSYFPLVVPVIPLNLVIGLTLRKRQAR